MKRPLFERKQLRRTDGEVFLDRWGVEHDRVGGIFLHRMDAPDPGIDLHDHPWWFGSFIIAGGYIEERAWTRDAPLLAAIADRFHVGAHRGVSELRRRWSWRTMRLDECHRITELTSRRCWTLVVHGPRRRGWGFYMPQPSTDLLQGFVDERTYDEKVRPERRDVEVTRGDRG